MWLSKITRSEDVCVGDITPIKTIEWWEKKQKPGYKFNVESFAHLHSEPIPVFSVCTDNKIDVKKYFEDKPFGNERLSTLRNTFGDAMAWKKTEEQRIRAKQIRKKSK